MPKRLSNKRQDVDVVATKIVEAAIGKEMTGATQQSKPEKNPAAVALGYLGGKKGGLARASKLTAAQRSEIAKKAALARWRGRQY